MLQFLKNQTSAPTEQTGTVGNSYGQSYGTVDEFYGQSYGTVGDSHGQSYGQRSVCAIMVKLKLSF